jgi:hypothetical protein
MGLFSQISGPVKQVVAKLVSDPNMGKDVTYKRFVSSSFDNTLKRNVDVYQDFSIRGISLRHNRRSVQTAPGEIEVGDPIYLFKYDDFPPPETPGSVRDLIVTEEGKILKVKEIQSIFELAVSVSVEGVV